MFIPFDFNPVSVSVKTGAYTVPAGRYAYVVNASGGEFSIGGTVAVEGPNNFYSETLTSGGGFVLKYTHTFTVSGTYMVTLNTNFGSTTLKATIQTAGGTEQDLFQMSGTGTGSFVDSDAVTEIFHFREGDVLRIRHSGNGATSRAGMTGVRESIVDGGFWVPTGTNLDGDRYTVSEFNIAT